MNTQIPYKPYRPSLVHAFLAMVDRLPGPSWLYYVGFIVIIGLLNLSIAWIRHVLPLGEINWYFASTAFFLGYYLFVLDIIFRAAKDSVVEFLPKMHKSDEESSQILFEFTHLPSRGSILVSFFGVISGITLSLIQLPNAMEWNPAFPVLEVVVFSFSTCLVLLADYAVYRASKLIVHIFSSMDKVDIYDLTSIYAITKYYALILAITIPPTYLIFVLAPTFIELASYYFLVSLVLFWSMMLLIFWSPLRTVNQKMVFEKRRLLKEVNFRIKKTFELINHKTDAQEYGEIRELHEVINSLKNEKDFIESISTWPWKPATLTGLLSAIVLPLVIAILSQLISRFL